MTLLPLNDIQQGLDKLFLSLEPDLTGFRLLPSSTNHTEIACFEQQLNLTLPIDFKEIIQQFDFGNLTIGPVVFSACGDYLAELFEFNESLNWWGTTDSRPQNYLMVATADIYLILMDVTNGRIFAFDREAHWQSLRVIAGSFSIFIQAVGSVMLQRHPDKNNNSLAAKICTSIQGEDISFWEFLAG